MILNNKVNQDAIKVIGSNQSPREDSKLVILNELDSLKIIFDDQIEDWSDFDSWRNLDSQQFIFLLALDILKGKKIDINCGCCKYCYVSPIDFKNRLNDKCYGIKTAFIIEKVVDEIILAKARRENDGTYFV